MALAAFLPLQQVRYHDAETSPFGPGETGSAVSRASRAVL